VGIDRTHQHDQTSHRAANRKRLALTLLLAGGYMVAEIVGGLISNSLALLADAAHMLSDVAALALSLFAIWIAERPATSRRTYGFYRVEILAALLNGAALIAISAYIFVEAYRRLQQPPPVMGALMMWIAVGGFLVNLLGLWILHGGREDNLNVRGAWLHVFTDTLGSIGAVVAGSLIWTFGLNWIDPAISALIGLLVVYSAWRLVAESVSVLMENAPRGIDVDEVHRAMSEIAGVVSIHDLHVWTISSGLDCLSAHVVKEDGQSHGCLLKRLRTTAREEFGIDQITIQIEPEEFSEQRTEI
jgi:cobalt-zinc-cadmium efflux system protein